MPIKYVGFNPEVILRRFYKMGVNISENAIFKKLQSNCGKWSFFFWNKISWVFLGKEIERHIIFKPATNNLSLCLNWSQTSKTGFLVTRLILEE